MIATPRQRGRAQGRPNPAARGGDPDPERDEIGNRALFRPGRA